MKRCLECGKSKPVGEFGSDAAKADGRREYCRPCQRRLDVERLGGLRALRAPGRRPGVERDGDKGQARRRVQYLVRSGQLAPAGTQTCVDCGARAASYEHPSFASGDHTKVEAVCSTCRGKRTARLGRGRGPDKKRRRRRQAGAI